MEKIILYIAKKYGIMLTEEEAKILLEWYKRNIGRLDNEDIVDKEVREFLFKTFKNKKMHVFAEDTSDMKYLLALLKENNK